jgi:carbon monoxide dehydrogenase subunit G
MEITNQFVVPLAPAEAWDVLLDIGRIVPCVPGAELIEMLDDSTYKGKVSVKLGPVALAFVGTARFEELDAAARRAKVLAKGSDAKGRGGANAAVQFRLEAIETGTRVVVETSLMLSGSVAQYGRAVGIVQGLASQLTAQFARNLQAMLAEKGEGAALGPAAVAAPVAEASGSSAGAADRAAVLQISSPTAAAPSPGPAAAIAAAARLEAAAARAEAAASRIEAAIGRLETVVPAPAPPQAKPISGFSLMLRVLWSMIAGLFSSKGKA